MSIQPVAGQGWIPTDDTFGARLALVRQRMGWGNVKEAAMACGVPAGSWRNWERDGRLPRDLAKIAALIAERTGADCDWLIRGAAYPQGGRPLNKSGCTVRDSNPEPADSRKPAGHTSLLMIGRSWVPVTAAIGHTTDPQGHPLESICHIPETLPA
jgi:transcriptional regulator with XRE-family HTH domain